MPPDRWTVFRERCLSLPELGFAVDLSALAMPAGFLDSMDARMREAFAAMAGLEKGAIANPDEKRRVGHYWLRDPERAPDPAIARAIVETNEKIVAFASRVHRGELKPERAGRFENVIVIGIGGSALGPMFVSGALGSPKDPTRAFFVDNTDPDGIDLVIGQVAATPAGLASALAITISKSGGTKETRNGMLEVAAAYRAEGLRFEKQAVAVTGEGSELDRVATEGGWLERFPMWDWIGGRTSELSAVGLLPAALQGFDIAEMLAGARAMDAATRVTETRRNPAALLALAWHYATGGTGAKDMVILPYKDRLALFSRYLQQLVMESLGKEKDLAGKIVHQGIAVYGNKGSTDQHAYVQQLRDGVPNFFVTFLEVLRDRKGLSMEVEPGVTSGDFLSAFLQGTRRALKEKGRESITITMDDVTPRSVGALIALYERTVGFYGSLIHVNAYHQPGVEAGKKAAASILSLQSKSLAALRASKTPMTADQVAAAIDSPEETEAVFHILRHLAANDRGITAEPGRNTFDVRFKA